MASRDNNWDQFLEDMENFGFYCLYSEGAEADRILEYALGVGLSIIEDGSTVWIQ